jgi:hypothetical protein
VFDQWREEFQFYKPQSALWHRISQRSTTKESGRLHFLWKSHAGAQKGENKVRAERERERVAGGARSHKLLMILYHFIVDFMEVNFTDFIDYVFTLESDKPETCNTTQETF